MTAPALVASVPLQHGIYAEIPLLPTETREHFDAALACLLDAHRPATALANELVHELHTCKWRIARMHRIESGCMTRAILEQKSLPPADADNPESRDLLEAAAFDTKRRLFDQIRRHSRQLERERELLEKRLEAHRLEQEDAIRQADWKVQMDETRQRIRERTGAPGFVPAKPATPGTEAVSTEPMDSKFATAETVVAATEPIPTFTGPMRDIKRRNWMHNHAQAAA